MMTVLEHTICFWLELDEKGTRATDYQQFRLRADGSVETSDLGLLSLSKAAAVFDSDSSRLVPFDRWNRLKNTHPSVESSAD